MKHARLFMMGYDFVDKQQRDANVASRCYFPISYASDTVAEPEYLFWILILPG